MKQRDRTGIGAIVASVVLVVAVAVAAPGWAVFAALALATVLWVLLLPRLATPVLLVGLAFQGAIARLLERASPTMTAAVQSLDEIALLAAGLRIAVLLVGGERAWLRLGDWWWAILFASCGVLSSLMHWSGVASAALGFALACKFFCFLLLVLSIPWKSTDGERLVEALAWAAPVLLVLGFLGFLFPRFTAAHLAASEGDVDYTRGGLTPFMVPFINPGLYGWATAVTTLAALTLMLERRAFLYWPSLLSGAAGVLLSLRRRPLISIPIAILASLTQLNARQRVYAVFITVLTVAALAWFGRDLVRVTIEDTLENYRDPVARANTARAAMLATSVVIARNRFPLGEGFGRFGGFASQRYYSSVYDEYGLSRVYGLGPDDPYYITDTYWPHLLGEVGVLGALAMAGMLFATWSRIQRVYRDPSTDSALRTVALFASLVLVESAMGSLAGPVYEVSLEAFTLALPIGMVLRLSRAPARTVSSPQDGVLPNQRW